MPEARIIEYAQRTEPRMVGGMPRASGEDSYSSGRLAVARGANDLAQGMQNLGFALKEKTDADAQAWTAAALSQSRLDWASRLEERKQSLKPEELGAFTPKLLAEFDDYAGKAIGNAPTEEAKSFLHQRMLELRTSLGAEALQYQAAAQVDYRIDKYGAAVDNTKKLMNTDPSQYGVALAEQLAVIDSAALPPIQKSALRQKAIDEISSSAVWSQIQRSPTAFLKSIGFLGDTVDPVTGVTRKSSGDLMGTTGNQAFDALSSEKRVSLFEGAIRLKAQIDNDANVAAEKARKELSDTYMKEAWGRLQDGKLRRDFIEQIRPALSNDDYRALLKGLRGDGAGAMTDPGTYRKLQQLIYSDPREAERFAFSAHKNGLLSNEHLSSGLARARELSRTEGPKSEYERSRQYVVGSLDPGPMVQDPIGRARLADALDTFDRWVGESKRTDEEIRRRGQEVVQQFRFIDMSNTVAALPSPRSGSIRRNPGDAPGMMQDIAAAANKAKSDHEKGVLSKEEYESEMALINRWRKTIDIGAPK